MTATAYAVIGVLVGFALGLLIALWRKRPDLAQPLEQTERRLAESFSKANADMAARVESVKGELRTSLGEQVQQGLGSIRDLLDHQLAEGREEQARRLRDAVERLETKFAALQAATENRLTQFAETQGTALRDSRVELTGAFTRLSERNEVKLEEVRRTVEEKLGKIQADNAAQLEQMRRTVDEKLQGTLEQRLGESFKLVSERLELVHKGLGEMQTLASGVGDLKKVLTNVKTRGTWGEMQLGNLLEQVLTPEQYATNISTRAGSTDRVEFALKLPGKDRDQITPVWLPIDAKFPKEDYERLVEASENADPVALELAAAQLEARVKGEARSIRDKYLDPPHTTDFAILYLPVEGLYAEVLRRPGLMDVLQREFRVTVAGPTVLTALLNSLQMGFRTLAIEKRSSEVWTVLAAVKTEFGRFGEVIDKVQKKLQEASNVIDTAAVRTRAIERRLRTVQELPAEQARTLLDDPELPLTIPDEGSLGK
jgi:DNA recombination protein RmuC